MSLFTAPFSSLLHRITSSLLLPSLMADSSNLLSASSLSTTLSPTSLSPSSSPPSPSSPSSSSSSSSPSSSWPKKNHSSAKKIPPPSSLPLPPRNPRPPRPSSSFSSPSPSPSSPSSSSSSSSSSRYSTSSSPHPRAPRPSSSSSFNSSSSRSRAPRPRAPLPFSQESYSGIELRGPEEQYYKAGGVLVVKKVRGNEEGNPWSYYGLIGLEPRWDQGPGFKASMLGGKREVRVDKGSIETCFREFWEESGGNLSDADVKYLQSKIGTPAAMVTWIPAGKYVLYVVVVSEEHSAEEAALVERLTDLPAHLKDDSESKDKFFSEMDELLWVKLSAETLKDISSASETFLAEKEGGEKLLLRPATFFRVTCRVRPFSGAMASLFKSGELMKLPQGPRSERPRSETGEVELLTKAFDGDWMGSKEEGEKGFVKSQ